MNLKIHYQKVRDIEQSLPEPDVVIVSQETPEGGREGVLTEVPRHIAARLVVEGKARVASEEEAEKHRREMREAARAAEEAAMASKLQVAIVSESEMRSLKSGAKTPKN